MFATLSPLEFISENEILSTHPETSFPFPLEESHVYDLGIRKVQFDQQPPFGRYEHGDLRIENDSIFLSWKPVEITPEDIARRRLEEEESGIVVNGIHINTGRMHRNGIYEHAFICTINPNHTTYWKDDNQNFVLLGAAEIQNISIAISSHTDRCFVREQELVSMLNEGSLTNEQLQIFWGDEDV